MRNPDRLLSALHYGDAIAEADAAGYEFPTNTTELLQQAIVAFSQFECENIDAEQDEEEEEEQDEEDADDADINES